MAFSDTDRYLLWRLHERYKFIARTVMGFPVTEGRTGIVQSVKWLGYGLDGWRIVICLWHRREVYVFPITFKLGVLPFQLTIHCIWGALSPEVKRVGREADHSP